MAILFEQSSSTFPSDFVASHALPTCPGDTRLGILAEKHYTFGCNNVQQRKFSLVVAELPQRAQRRAKPGPRQWIDESVFTSWPRNHHIPSGAAHTDFLDIILEGLLNVARWICSCRHFSEAGHLRSWLLTEWGGRVIDCCQCLFTHGL